MLNTPQSFLAPAAAGLLALQTGCGVKYTDSGDTGFDDHVETSSPEQNEAYCFDDNGNQVAQVERGPSHSASEYQAYSEENGVILTLTKDTQGSIEVIFNDRDLDNGRVTCKLPAARDGARFGFNFPQMTGMDYVAVGFTDFDCEDNRDPYRIDPHGNGYSGYCYGPYYVTELVY